jgi:hypothetical protein
MKRALLIGVLMLAAGLSGARPSRAQSVTQSAAQLATEAQVFGAEDQFRRAKVENNTATLGVLLNEAFLETNQNGNSRNKAEMISLFESFPISSLTTDKADIRFAATGIAVVHGSQTERRGTAVDMMLFTRVWVREGGSWQLLSSSQFRDPRSSPFDVLRRLSGVR